MRQIKLPMIIAVLAFATPLAAEEVRRNLPACVTEELLDELTTYSTKRDYDGFQRLVMSGQCTVLPVGAGDVPFRVERSRR